MYIPIVEIPGCRPGYRTDNRGPDQTSEAQTPIGYEPEPRETVAIHLSSLPTYEAVAEFYAYIAYPDLDEATQRQKYSIALSRWAVLQRGEFDKTWDKTEQMIRPIVFSQPEKLFLNTYRLGSIKWWRKAQCAFLMLLPHLVNEMFQGLPPTVGNIALMASDTFGYRPGSHKTIESKIWRPTKPVAHAAAAVMLCLGVLNNPEQNWDDQHQLCYQQQFLATLFYEDVFRNFLLNLSELLRLQVPSCDRFKIREKETIRFIAD